jgi:hypothetical protein
MRAMFLTRLRWVWLVRAVATIVGDVPTPVKVTADQAPGNGEAQVHIVQGIDVARFLSTFRSYASQ